MNKQENADVIRFCGENGDYYWLSEKAERKLTWILTGLMVILTVPVFALSLLV